MFLEMTENKLELFKNLIFVPFPLDVNRIKHDTNPSQWQVEAHNFENKKLLSRIVLVKNVKHCLFYEARCQVVQTAIFRGGAAMQKWVITLIIYKEKHDWLIVKLVKLLTKTINRRVSVDKLPRHLKTAVFEIALRYPVAED